MKSDSGISPLGLANEIINRDFFQFINRRPSCPTPAIGLVELCNTYGGTRRLGEKIELAVAIVFAQGLLNKSVLETKFKNYNL